MATPLIDQVYVACVDYTQSTIAFTTASDTLAGALLVLAAGTDYAPSGDAIESPGTKWTAHDGSVQGYPFFGKLYTATALAEGGSETVSVSFTSNSENGAVLWVIPDATVDDVVLSGANGGAQTAPSVTATEVDDLLLCVWMMGAGTYTPPSVMTTDGQKSEPEGFMTALAAHEALSASGATGSRICTPTDGSWIAFSIAVKGVGTQVVETHSLTASIYMGLSTTVSQTKTADVSSQILSHLVSDTTQMKTATVNTSTSLNLNSVNNFTKHVSVTALAPLSLSQQSYLAQGMELSTRDITLVSGSMTEGWSGGSSLSSGWIGSEPTGDVWSGSAPTSGWSGSGPVT